MISLDKQTRDYRIIVDELNKDREFKVIDKIRLESELIDHRITAVLAYHDYESEYKFNRLLEYWALPPGKGLA